jgi:hypothetical protein
MIVKMMQGLNSISGSQPDLARRLAIVASPYALAKLMKINDAEFEQDLLFNIGGNLFMMFMRKTLLKKPAAQAAP